MKLYEIDAGIEACVDTETGEIIDTEKLAALKMEREKKIENIALWIKDLKSEAEALKKEKEAFAAREMAAENKADSLKKFLAAYLDGRKYKSEKVSVSFRRSESVTVIDETAIPAGFRIAQPEKIDKLSLKKALKAGAVIDGAYLEEKENIQIK